MAQTIALAGKGGVGKTTICGMLIEYLTARHNGAVLAVDADANSNLNEVLGVEVALTLGDIRENIARAEMEAQSPIPQGMTKADIELAWPGAHAARGQDMAHFCPPHGESFMQAQRRALAAVARWRRFYPGATLLMVSHAGILGSLLAHYLALPLKDVLRIPQYYGCRAFVPEW